MVYSIHVIHHDESTLIAQCDGAFLDNVECLRLLLNKGADPNKANNWGETPTQAACEKGGVLMGQEELVLIRTIFRFRGVFEASAQSRGRSEYR